LAKTPAGVETALDGFHGFDLFGRILDGKELRFPLSETVSSNYGAAEFRGLFGENHEGGGAGVELFLGYWEHVDVRMGVADVAENAVVAGHDPLHVFAVEGEHFAVLFDGDGEVRAEGRKAVFLRDYEGGFRERMAEFEEAFAVKIGGSEPAFFESSQ